jgi:hypothetical protein
MNQTMRHGVLWVGAMQKLLVMALHGFIALHNKSKQALVLGSQLTPEVANKVPATLRLLFAYK